MSSVALGILLATCGAASLAFGMVIQRYALSQQSDHVHLCGVQLTKNTMWFMGLVVYGIANGFYAMSLLFGPLSVLAGVFTTLLVFNMLFAWALLGEKLTTPRVTGSLVILGGVVLCIAGAPTDVETEFTPREIANLSKRPVGALYISILLSIVIASFIVINWYEMKFPSQENDKRASKTEVTVDDIQQPEDESIALATPPSSLAWIMELVYPGSLGVDEGIAHLTMKASVSMYVMLHMKCICF